MAPDLSGDHLNIFPTIGYSYGAWIVRSRGPNYRVGQNNHRQWWCEYARTKRIGEYCGNGRLVSSTALLQGRSKSCGCLKADLSAKRKLKHELSTSAEYRTVKFHLDAHNHSHHDAHYLYADIPFEPTWNPKFGGDIATGVRWILRYLGPKPSPKHSLDIIVRSLGFVPGNLKWATKKEQANNRRNYSLFNAPPDVFDAEARKRGYTRVG
jgi:hypothetical protein